MNLAHKALYPRGVIPVLTRLLLLFILGMLPVVLVWEMRDRSQNLFSQMAEANLGGDGRIQTREPLTPQALQIIRALPQARLVEIDTMITASPNQPADQQPPPLLAEVQGVSDNFPLKGNLRVSPRISDWVPSDSRPALSVGKVFISAAMAERLGYGLGDSIKIGIASFVIDGFIHPDPRDFTLQFRNQGLLIISENDLAKTGLIQVGSRVRYLTFFLSPQADLIAQKLEELQLPSLSVETPTSAENQLSVLLNRSQDLFLLFASISLLLGLLNGYWLIKTFVSQRWEVMGIAHLLGVSRRWLIIRMAIPTIAGATFAGAISGAITVGIPPVKGLVTQGYGLLMGPLLGLSLGMILSLITLMPLAKASALDFFRQSPGRWQHLAIVALIFSLALVPLYSEARFGWIALGVLGASVLISGALWLAAQNIARRILSGSPKIRLFANGHGTWRWTRFDRLPLLTVLSTNIWLTITTLGLSIGFQQAIDSSKTAPDWFFTNLPRDAGQAFKDALQAQGATSIDSYRIFPMLLEQINGQSLQSAAPPDLSAFEQRRRQRLARRHFLTTVAPGSSTQPIYATVEEDLARTMGIKLGDQLEFNLYGVPFQAPVARFRKVNWLTLRPNFFVVFHHAPALEQAPHTWMITAKGVLNNLNGLVRTFPSVVIIDVKQIIGAMRLLMADLNWLVIFFLGFNLANGLILVLILQSADRPAHQEEQRTLEVLGAWEQLRMAAQKRDQIIQFLAVVTASLIAMTGTTVLILENVLGLTLDSPVQTLIFSPATLCVMGVFGLIWFLGNFLTRSSIIPTNRV